MADFTEHPDEFLANKSAKRIQSVKYPRQSWRGRARCFQLFEQNLTPSDISPRMCGVTRKTLYRYYEDFKLLRAKRIVTFRAAKAKREQEARLAKERMEEERAAAWRSGLPYRPTTG